jgi:hypothetical protein
MLVAHPENYQLTTSAGTVSKTIFTGGGNVCYEIYVEATTPTTTFDVTLTDRFGHVTFERYDITGKLSETLQKIAYGNWTFKIENASADENFNVLIVMRET